jgi:hypothetical protein
MTYITATLTIIVTLCWCEADYATTYVKADTSTVALKQGTLRGHVVAFRTNRNLPSVEQYKGIPYAAPPVGELRFMPPGSAPQLRIQQDAQRHRVRTGVPPEVPRCGGDDAGEESGVLEAEEIPHERERGLLVSQCLRAVQG